MTKAIPRRSSRENIVIGFVLFLSSLLAYGALMLPFLTRMQAPAVEVGMVAAQTYNAPETTSFVSQVRTEALREEAAQSVVPIYTSPDTGVARQQLDHLRNALAYITNVRLDEFSTVEQKVIDLAALDNLQLSQDTARAILNLSETRWQTLQQEASDVLKTVMQGTIRPDNLATVRSSVPNLVSVTIPQEQAEIAAELAEAFVVPNSLYSASLTEDARQRAREAVEPVVVSFAAGETIVQQGQRLTPETVEALQELGLGQNQTSWQEPVSAAILTVVSAVLISMFFNHKPGLVNGLPSVALLALLFLLSLFAARVSIPGHTIIPYVFPLSAYALTVATLFGAEVALVTSLPLAFLSAYGLPYALDLTLFYTLGSFFGIFALGNARRMMSFAWAGGAVAFAGIMVVLVFRLPLPSTDLLGIATLTGAAAFNGLASASLTIVLQYFLSQLLGMTTPMQLMELTRPDHPLLGLLLRDVPGTYQHSLQVANLAEQAAEAIGADALLTRVGALYHDAGKAVNAYFFIENQVPGLENPHNDLDPETSATIIIRHVSDGVEMARKYRLPRRIDDFIREHHGSLLTSYQYVNAVRMAGGDRSQVDESKFRYPGPRPQSRETAILMLADGSEARVRAERPKTEEDLRSLIRNVIENRVEAGELDDTDLTLNDLNLIADSFTATLRGVYHPRVKYPKLEGKGEVPTQPAPVPLSGPVSVPGEAGKASAPAPASEG